MRIIYYLLLLICCTAFKAQVFIYPAASISYRTVPKHNILQVGLELAPYRKTSSTNSPFIFGASLLYTRINHKDKLIPEVNILYRSPQSIVGGTFAGTSVTPYAVEPRIGLNFYNVLLINTGYAIPIDKNKYFKGVTFGIQFNISGDRFYRGS